MKTYKSFIDYGDALAKLIGETQFNYKGILIKETIDGYSMGSKHYKTLEEIDLELERQYKNFDNSINRLK